MYDFDEYLLAYYIHPSYKGFGVKMSQYQRVQSTAARIWQQMLKDPNIATYLKKHDHSKKNKDRTAEELRTILSDAHLCDDDDEYVDDYNEEEMIKLVSSPPINDDCEQVRLQDLEILNVLDLDSMFKDKSNNITDKQLELDGLNDFIQELDEEDDFDPDLLVQNFNS
ncbi:uncharacterized protein OCT59_003633 [Rhizophagus irregularis]|uniref:uncharacterized protein n=1 Tax=Rhizophagus irregularis TaxID=588596 RepID=UPI0033325AC8|nr:hypothetical protein OCT59_003633 [Rhizophagus irregularis]